MTAHAHHSVHRVFLGLGSNLGDRAAQLNSAVQALPDVFAVSPFYATEPVGGPKEQPEFMNCVVELRTRVSARDLLATAHRIENRARRVRTEVNGPRTLDVDILLYGSETITEDDLIVPHPRMWERNFVLRPLADLAPELVSPADLARATGEVRRIS